MGASYSHDKTSELLRIAVVRIQQRLSACRLVIAQHYNLILDALKEGNAPQEAYDHAKICQEQYKRVQLLNTLERHCLDIRTSLHDLPNSAVPPPLLAVPIADVLYCAEEVDVVELYQICKQLELLYRGSDVIKTYRNHASAATVVLLDEVQGHEPYELLAQIMNGPQPPVRVDLVASGIKFTDVQTGSLRGG